MTKETRAKQQQSVSQEATNAQCGIQGSPRSLEITECKSHKQHSHRFIDTIQKLAMTLLCGIWGSRNKSETGCESGLMWVPVLLQDI